MNAQDIMTAPPIVVAASEPLHRAAELMAQFDVGAIPVVDSHRDSHLVGMITDRDIVIRHFARRGTCDCCVKHHMTARDIEFVHPGSDIHDVVGRMQRAQVRRLPVVDANGVVVGMIAQADIVRHFARRDSNLVAHLLHEISVPHALQIQVQV